MIHANGETISFEGEVFELMVDFVAVVGCLRFEKHVSDETIKKLVGFGLEKNTFDKMKKR